MERSSPGFGRECVSVPHWWLCSSCLSLTSVTRYDEHSQNSAPLTCLGLAKPIKRKFNKNELSPTNWLLCMYVCVFVWVRAWVCVCEDIRSKFLHFTPSGLSRSYDSSSSPQTGRANSSGGIVREAVCRRCGAPSFCAESSVPRKAMALWSQDIRTQRYRQRYTQSKHKSENGHPSVLSQIIFYVLSLQSRSESLEGKLWRDINLIFNAES